MSKEKNNMKAKIFALIISIILWSYVMSVENPEQTKKIKNISVNLYNTSYLDRQGLIIMEPKEIKIDVEVSGSKSDLDNKFSTSNIAASIDLTGYDEGQVRALVDVSLINNLSNVRIVNFEPKEILFTIDKIITKEKAVGVQIIGELDEGLVLGDLITKPEKIMIKGPRSWINEVAEVKIVIDVTGQKESINITRPIQITNYQGNEVKGVEKEPSRVEVSIPVLKKHTLPIELQTEGELPEGYILSEIKINPNMVEIKGDNSILNLTHINTKIINVNDLLDSSVLEVELDIPEGVDLVHQNEKVSISYVIQEVQSNSYSFKFDEIEMRNLADRLFIEDPRMNNNIDILLKATKEDLEKISKEDIILYMDFKDLTEGSHEVKVEMQAIPGISIENLNPDVLNIRLNRNTGVN